MPRIRAFQNDAAFYLLEIQFAPKLQANKFEFENSSRVKREVVQARVRKVDRIISMLTRRNRQNQIYQLSFERQFLYMVRHNPTGLIVYIGRYFQPHHHDHHEHQRR